MRRIVFVFVLLIIYLNSVSQTDSTYHKKMQWFADAKLGIFIHWGIYAVNGVSESWSFFNGDISHEDYLKQTEGFTASNYQPEYWAKLIKESGARYSVITSKHHDGFALWETKLGKLNAPKNSAAKRDVLSPFVKALRDNDIKLGLYFSLPDWSNNDYTHYTRIVNRYNVADEPKRWNTFLQYYRGQLIELKNKYDPDLWWFDGDWEHTADEWGIDHTKQILLKDKASVIFNSRLCGKGDYETPEIGLPVLRPKAEYWELCVTMNDSWGYQQKDTNYKSPQQIIDIFVDCISKGGNLLLDIGPKADGTIPIEQENIMKELGKWTLKHDKAIYNTLRGVPYDHYYGPTTISKDSTTLYLFLRDKPNNGQIPIKGISNKISDIKVLGHDQNLQHKTYCKVSWNTYPGIIYIDIPNEILDQYFTVIAIELEGKIDLYREKTGEIESN